ncbi:MAG: hypothetical protein Q3965_03040, partial [Rothia sp. (in: high G+C Gram-positive bacteria)]|nr:hypothetical protein [Rothia sp. (in: high G+C Gram-positive bacteria)]
MAPERKVQQEWQPLIEGLGFQKKNSRWDYHLPFNDEWTGVVSLSVMSNYGTGSSVSVALGPLWVPHMQLRNELTLITPDRGGPSYTESLYHLDPHLDERLGVAWPVQFDGPHSPIDLSA